MTARFEVPCAVGQLVWCPADPTLGAGVITQVETRSVVVKFFRLLEERTYTMRDRESAILRYFIGSGERVRDTKGSEHRVRRRIVDPKAACVTYELDVGDIMPESDLVPEVRDIGPRERLATLNLAHPEVVRARAQGLDLAQLGRRPGEAAILGARVEWLPHQIDVAVGALARDPLRMLLADEVGLGKTVEAVLIYAGLRQEGRAERVLVIAPESLCIQWLGEIFRKVHELFVLLDDQRLEDAASDFPDLSPFDVHRRVVVSMDRLAASRTLSQHVVAGAWDLVIVDEAHHLRWRADDGGNAAYRLLEGIAARSRHLLLLTATPMALDPAEYHALLRLLDPVRFEDPTRFEETAQRIEAIRELAQALGRAVSEGRALGAQAQERARKIFADDPVDRAAFDRFARLAPSSPERGAQSEVVMAALRHRHGLADYVVRNRRGPVGGLPERQARVIPLKPTEAQAILVEVGESVVLELARSFDDPATQRRTVGELLRALWATPRALQEILRPISAKLALELEPLVRAVTMAPADGRGLPTGDARLRWLVETIRSGEAREKVLVFVESAVAVQGLKEALEPIIGTVAVFHRGLSPRDQDRQVAWFRDSDGPQVMLSTEAGGEGRNFQFCHQVVLYDLPWRPATIEQRIGRIDRVGQRRDVTVWVPHFQGGIEAAILKVMQESIGVLDGTVGGIDPVLEYVSQDLSDLILEQRGVDAWKSLFRRTAKVVTEARHRIACGVDPILDFVSFSPERVAAFMARVPEALEGHVETFVERYADSAKLDLHPKGKHLWSVEGGPRAAGRHDDEETGYVGTFARQHALLHEDVEFLSFGHPLVEQALEWARTADDSSAAVAICRGFEKDSAAFLWRFSLELPEDVPETAAYLVDRTLTYALDESGRRLPELDGLLVDETRPFDRMEVAPLRSAGERWRRLVEQSHAAAEQAVEEALVALRRSAEGRLNDVFAARRRDLERQHRRELSLLGSKKKQRQLVEAQQQQGLVALEGERCRIQGALGLASPRLVAAVAVRLMRAKAVSA